MKLFGLRAGFKRTPLNPPLDLQLEWQQKIGTWLSYEGTIECLSPISPFDLSLSSKHLYCENGMYQYKFWGQKLPNFLLLLFLKESWYSTKHIDTRNSKVHIDYQYMVLALVSDDPTDPLSTNLGPKNFFSQSYWNCCFSGILVRFIT